MEVLNVQVSGPAVKKLLNGRTYLVAPLKMMTPGVRSGSRGPLLYTDEYTANSAKRWNGMPIVLGHPKNEEGKFVSARDPAVLETHSLGHVYNTSYTNGLVAEGWFDAEVTKERSLVVYNNLLKGEVTELSTGFDPILEETPGVHNGEAYDGVVLDIQPDHLAILIDEKGACSKDDGCGLHVNQGTEKPLTILTKIKTLLGMEATEQESSDDPVLSYDEITSALRNAVRPTGDDHPYTYVVDTYPNHFIYAMGDNYYRQGYTVNGQDVVLVGQSKEVKRKVVYNKDGNAQGSPGSSDGENIMNADEKKSLIDGLISNCSCKEKVWEESDRDVLNAFSDEKLKTLNKVLVEKVVKEEGQQALNSGVTNAETLAAPKQPTFSELLEAADPETRSVINRSVARAKQDKERLVGAIMGNARNKYTKEVLNTKDLEELENIHALIAPEPSSQQTYLGDGPSQVSNAQSLNQDNFLGLPSEKWAAEVANSKK